MSAARIAVSARIRIPAAMARRGSSRREKVVAMEVRWASMSVGRSWSSGSGPRSVRAIVGGEVGAGEGLRHELAHVLAVGAPTRLRREPAHDLAEVAGRGRAGRGDRLPDEGADLVLGQGGRQVFGDDGDPGLLAGDEFLAAAGTEGLDRFAARLHLASEHREVLVVGQGMALALLH